MYYLKEDIYRDLKYLNRKLAEEHYFLNLKVVGGSAFILNDLQSIETTDIDTAIRIETEIREIIDDCGVDINDDASEYDFDDLEFIFDNETFSNISIQYLTVGGVIKAKLMYEDEDKADALRYTMEDELGIDMTVEGISQYLEDECDIFASPDEIEYFLSMIGYI